MKVAESVSFNGVASGRSVVIQDGLTLASTGSQHHVDSMSDKANRREP